MAEKTLIIKNKLGLHARPSALFVQTASKYKSVLKVFQESQEADGKSIMGLMMLAAGIGTELRLVATGPDEKELLSSIEELVNRKFDEE